jgi:F-type H+-transporting ATPase subunit alpha
MSLIKRQVEEGSIVIYASIGKKKSDTHSLQSFFMENGVMSNTIIVSSDPQSTPTSVYLTPYTAMSIAEYFRDSGRDVVIILDDLSTHAKFYREISLLSGAFPGRDSYPGDIFYKHAQLMERAGNFNISDVGVSISCMAVAETVESDLASYITTNLMGMTDGHIFFDSGLFALGRRPAVNIPLSVTRVGRQVQTSLKKEINREIGVLLSSYDKLINYSHFGAELSQKVKEVIRKGEILFLLFDQHYKDSIPEAVQLLLYGLLWGNHFDGRSVTEILAIKNTLLEAYKDPKKRAIIEGVVTANSQYELFANINKDKSSLIVA